MIMRVLQRCTTDIGGKGLCTTGFGDTIGIGPESVRNRNSKLPGIGIGIESCTSLGFSLVSESKSH